MEEDLKETGVRSSTGIVKERAQWRRIVEKAKPTRGCDCLLKKRREKTYPYFP